MLGHYSTSLCREELRNYFLAGGKPQNAFAVGVEWEKLAVYRNNGEAIRYSGKRGVQAIFETLVNERGWKAVQASNGLPIALKKGDMSVTLEPGGQIELSGQKAWHLSDNAGELFEHLKEIKDVSDPLGMVWLGLGAQPFSTHDSIEWVPKDRYDVMREKLADRGRQTYRMMKETASVQISVDYLDEADAMAKFRLALALTPVFIALFANSPLEKGARSPYLSRRANIWSETDPARTGLIWDAFDPHYSFDAYAEYALDVPLLFLLRGGRWHGVGEISFREFLKNGWKELSPEPGDWELHLSSVFTEARLKTYIEIRSIDCQSPPLGMAAAALVKGLFYSPAALRAAWETVGEWSLQDRKRLMGEAPRLALKTRIGSGDLGGVAKTLFRLAEEGLPAEERKFLWPLESVLRSGQCPAERLLNALEGTHDADGLLERLIGHCEILKSKS